MSGHFLIRRYRRSRTSLTSGCVRHSVGHGTTILDPKGYISSDVETTTEELTHPRSNILSVHSDVASGYYGVSGTTWTPLVRVRSFVRLRTLRRIWATGNETRRIRGRWGLGGYMEESGGSKLLLESVEKTEVGNTNQQIIDRTFHFGWNPIPPCPTLAQMSSLQLTLEGMNLLTIFVAHCESGPRRWLTGKAFEIVSIPIAVINAARQAPLKENLYTP
ncbi:hypothetical protein EDC04DRAFT_2612229 [Pisolithus marmoratus]|nr:hypothetical protein EDC04DRAFT_2612229 [Pisolithus marmoratus]